jgi:ApbE family
MPMHPCAASDTSSPRDAGDTLGASWETWSTSVVLRVIDPAALAVARAVVEQELDAIDPACSRFRDDSELTRVNHSDGRAVAVSELLIDALKPPRSLREAPPPAGLKARATGEARRPRFVIDALHRKVALLALLLERSNEHHSRPASPRIVST